MNFHLFFLLLKVKFEIIFTTNKLFKKPRREIDKITELIMNMSDEDCLRDCEQYISTHSECKTRLITLITNTI